MSVTIRFQTRRSGSIHTDWMMFWPPLTKGVFGPAAMTAGVMGFTSGFDVIARGGLKDHPVYREYIDKATLLRGFFQLHEPTPSSPHPLAVQHASDLRQAALEDPHILFALPGEPIYRRALGQTAPPPLARFSNFDVAARRCAIGKQLAAQEGTPWEDDFALTCAGLEQRLARFRAAEYAVSIGLPPHAFDLTAARRAAPTADAASAGR